MKESAYIINGKCVERVADKYFTIDCRYKHSLEEAVSYAHVESERLGIKITKCVSVDIYTNGEHRREFL